jgi:hypothetical protein
MKKVLSVAAFMAIASLIAPNGAFVPKLYAESAFDQLQDASDSGQQGADKADHGDYEGAKNDSGASFDGNSYDSPPPVDLTGKEGVVDPNDLKQYDPPSDGGPIE